MVIAEIADYTVTYSKAHKANLKVQFMALSFPINTDRKSVV